MRHISHEESHHGVLPFLLEHLSSILVVAESSLYRELSICFKCLKFKKNICKFFTQLIQMNPLPSSLSLTPPSLPNSLPLSLSLSLSLCSTSRPVCCSVCWPAPCSCR